MAMVTEAEKIKSVNVYGYKFLSPPPPDLVTLEWVKPNLSAWERFTKYFGDYYFEGKCNILEAFIMALAREHHNRVVERM